MGSLGYGVIIARHTLHRSDDRDGFPIDTGIAWPEGLSDWVGLRLISGLRESWSGAWVIDCSGIGLGLSLGLGLGAIGIGYGDGIRDGIGYGDWDWLFANDFGAEIDKHGVPTFIDTSGNVRLRRVAQLEGTGRTELAAESASLRSAR